MKKFILALGLVAASTAFAGGFGTVEYQNRDGVNGAADARATKVTIGTDLTSDIKADFSIRQKTNDDNQLSDNRVEGGLTYTTPIAGSLSAYGRVGLGQKFKSSSDYTYYSVEPGVKYAVTPALTAKLGYRFRDATDSANADQTRAWRVGAEYALSKNYFVGVGYDRVRGDSEYNSYNLAVGFKF